jgi:serine O-acetyltransferase
MTASFLHRMLGDQNRSQEPEVPLGPRRRTTYGASRADAVALHHVAQRAHKRGIPLLPGLIDLLIFLIFNSVIHHTTVIGVGTRCGYRGMSVLVHKDAVIGCNVMLGAHVVIGGRAGHARAPVIDDDTYVGANACIIGDVHVGRGAVIGAAAVVTRDVTPHTTVAGNPARPIERATR